MPKEYQTITIKSFHKGEVLDPKTDVNLTAAQIMRNITFDRAGKIGVYGREGFANFGGSGFPTGRVLGFVNFTDSSQTLYLLAAVVNTGTNDATLYKYDAGLDQWVSVGALPNAGTHPLSRYTFAGHFDQTSDKLKLYFTNGAGLFAWDGSGAITEVTAAPLAKYITSFYNSLFLLRDNAASGAKPMRLYFSDVNLPESWGPFNNIDLISTNTASLSRGHDGSEITGWANWNTDLLIMKRNGIHAVQGFDIETIQQQRRDLGLFAGCMAPFSVAVTPIGVIFLDKHRVWRFQGGQPTEISRSVIDRIKQITDFFNVKSAYIETDSMTAYWMTLDVSNICDTALLYDVSYDAWAERAYTMNASNDSFLFHSLAVVEHPTTNDPILLAGLDNRIVQLATGTTFTEGGGAWSVVRPTYRSPWFGSEDRMAQAFCLGLVGRGTVEAVVYLEGFRGTDAVKETEPIVFDLGAYVDPGEPLQFPISAFETFRPVNARRYAVELRSHADGDKWWVEQIFFDLQGRGKWLRKRT